MQRTALAQDTETETERDAISQDLRYLTGSEAAGRLSGTDGARRASVYLAQALEDLGLTPAGNDGYFRWLDVAAARLTGPARLKATIASDVTGSAKTRTYQHRKDFAEMSSLSSGGTVKAPLVVVTEEAQEESGLRPEDLKGKIALIPKRPAGFDFGATVTTAADLGVVALLVEMGEPAWFHKTVYGSPNNRIPVLRVTASLATELVAAAATAAAAGRSAGAADGGDGAANAAVRAAAPSPVEVEIDLPLSFQWLPCRNVLGLLPAGRLAGGHLPGSLMPSTHATSALTRTVAITAHFDHVGDDPAGPRFPGAMDNASGVATVLAVLRALAAPARRTRLPFNLLVGFLTGEESGLWGAKDLAAHPPRPLSAAINLDGIGFEPALRAIRLGRSAPGHWLADLAAETFQGLGIEVRWVTGTDDSAAFMNAGLSTLGLGQMATEPWPAAMHTPEDTAEVLHLSTIKEGADAILSLLDRLAARPARAF